jgi:hypothetical protein
MAYEIELLRITDLQEADITNCTFDEFFNLAEEKLLQLPEEKSVRAFTAPDRVYYREYRLIKFIIKNIEIYIRLSATEEGTSESIFLYRIIKERVFTFSNTYKWFKGSKGPSLNTILTKIENHYLLKYILRSSKNIKTYNGLLIHNRGRHNGKDLLEFGQRVYVIGEKFFLGFDPLLFLKDYEQDKGTQYKDLRVQQLDRSRYHMAVSYSYDSSYLARAYCKTELIINLDEFEYERYEVDCEHESLR